MTHPLENIFTDTHFISHAPILAGEYPRVKIEWVRISANYYVGRVRYFQKETLFVPGQRYVNLTYNPIESMLEVKFTSDGKETTYRMNNKKPIRYADVQWATFWVHGLLQWEDL